MIFTDFHFTFTSESILTSLEDIAPSELFEQLFVSVVRVLLVATFTRKMISLNLEIQIVLVFISIFFFSSFLHSRHHQQEFNLNIYR